MSAIQPLAVLAFILAVSACSPKPKNEGREIAAQGDKGALLRVGSIVVSQADLDHQLKENHGGRSDEGSRKKALEELAARAQFAQAALDAGLDRDPVVRAETARVLATRLKETTLSPRLKDVAGAIPEARLREIYAAEEGRFRSNEKRQVAVLWLNSNGNPEREKQYADKLTGARDWFFKTGDLKGYPEKGFSVLGVDYSEHQASRYKGGVVGWLEREGGMDAWTKAVAEIAFSLKEPGEVSAVIPRPEGVFLVRYMAQKPAVLRPFESVAAELERLERQRLREKAETEFAGTIKAKYPVQWLTSPQP